MAQNIQDTGLGNLDQIYLSIIPPLSTEQKLPEPDAIIKLAQSHAKQHEHLQHSKEAGDAYLWLFRTAKTFSKGSSIATKATAMLMEYLRTVTLSLELREDQKYDESDINDLKGLRSTLEQELRSVDRGVLSSLMSLYEGKPRDWSCIPVQEARSGWVDGAEYAEASRYPETFNYTELHSLAKSSEWWKVRDLLKKEDANPKDIHDWTPLHYAAAKGCTETVENLVWHQANVNAPDLLEWTPLHYACQFGYTSVVQYLVHNGAELDLRGRDGVAPLHCAAMHGHQVVVRSLIEGGAALDILDASGDTPLH